MTNKTTVLAGTSTSDIALFGLRVTIGGYLATHGAQKLFGAFGGPGLNKTARWFEHLGLRPGKVFAALAAGSELAGGVLTAAGAAHPVGPVALAGSMTVASVTQAEKGPLLDKGGFELPAVYLSAALGLIGTGPGRYSVDHLTGLQLPKRIVVATVIGAVALTTYSAVRVVRTKRPTPSKRDTTATAPSAEEKSTPTTA